MFIKSIRFKITIVYMAILALTLSVFSMMLYHYVKRSLYENMDTLLRAKGEDIVHAVSSYWAAEKVGAKRYGFRADGSRIELDIDFAAIAQRWVEAKSKDPKLLDIIVQIFDTQGNPVASSKNTQGITSVSNENFVSVLQGRTFFDTLTPTFPTRRVIGFRVFLTPITQENEVIYVVQVASPLVSIQTALNILRVTLFVLFPVTVLLTGVMGAFLAKLTLRPVDSMIKTIHDITAENMKLEIAITNTKDEIEKLAETFNDMLKRLDNAFTSQKQLFEDLSHQLNTPLTVLKGEFEVGLKKMRSQEEYESIFKSSLEEINKIVKLVDNLLILARLESKRILPDRKELDLNLLAQGVVNSIKSLAERKGVGISLSRNEETAIIGDETELKHLFLNLIDNAIKYTPQGGKVTIGMAKDRDKAYIKISDTGMGISQEDLPHIFDRFYRAEKGAPGQGFGLGLSIVKSIVDAHKGSIKAESLPGKGSTLTVSLPLR